MVKPDDLAKKRHELNVYSRTNRPLENEAERLGVAGELALANLLGIEHTPKSSAPTRGYQFDLGSQNKIKITTSRTPGNLFVKQGKATADVYVLAGVEGDAVMENVYFVGWIHGEFVRKAKITVPTKAGVYIQPAHKIARQDLMPMPSFLHALDRNPEHLFRFPLSKNGDYDVVEKPRQPTQPRQPSVQKELVYKPLPMKKPKS